MSDDIHALVPSADALREALAVFEQGQTGVRYDALLAFAEPLLTRYEVDARAAARSDDAEALATLVAVMETARLFWAYCTLDETEALRYLPEFEAVLLGNHASEEARYEFLGLLAELEEHWHSMDPLLRAEADQVPGYAPPPIDLLLAGYADAHADGPAAHDGLEGMELPDALALFAQPLLDDPRLHEDPDLLDDLMARAHAYWDLAQRPGSAFEAEVRKLQRLFATTAEDEAAIAQEARRMVARFRKLFPERSAL